MLFEDFLRSRGREKLSSDDLQALESAVVEVKTIPARQTLVHAGDPVTMSTYLLDGFIARAMDDREGQRQLVAVQVPGDFVDLHGYPLKRLDHDVVTLTQARVAFVPHDRLDGILESRPNLAKLLWFSTLLDAAMHREWIFRLGRLDAVARVAHFFCEIEAKLRAVGRSDGCRFALPLTQVDISEACGLTPVHINRMIRELRGSELLRTQSGIVEVLDRARLERLAEFTSSYLFLDFDPLGNC
jgi:CRP-like cAMP-binding protein